MSLPALRHDMPALTDDQVALIKRTVAKGATDDELALFLHAAQRTGLDPLMKQIHAVKRWDKNAGREVMAIQTGIDGLRLVAERTGRYAPGPEPSFTYLGDGPATGAPLTATAYVRKMTADGTWHVVSDTAHWSEFVQTTKEGRPTRFWQQMPHVMLAKCAEAKALRRAFPMELSGVYTWDEMGQAENDGGPVTPTPPPMPRRLSERPEAPPPDPVLVIDKEDARAILADDPEEARIGAEVFGTYGEGRDPTDLLGDEEKHALKEYVLEHGITEKALSAYCRTLGVKKGVLTVAQAKMIRQWVNAQ